MSARRDDLARIREGLLAAAKALEPFTPGAIEAERKKGGDPVTEADRAVDDVLKRLLPAAGEGWLSEETRDDRTRLDCRRVWVVDPVDGTREFIAGIPEWCISIALVEEGRPVAGGIHSPVAGQLFLGAPGEGLTLNGEPARVVDRRRLAGAKVLASRSEIRRGEWERFEGGELEIRPCGSVAYKMAQVAAGLADLTWTLVPKHEWDVAAGAALVEAGGGRVRIPDQGEPRFNRPHPLFPGFAAYPASLAPAVEELLGLRAEA
ncbi:MAG: 3'(2'),5'-bisphosphate nucleotidase CysQ [Thermoanaerobaculia bacterium]|nr:3'(2'),5'-bisphosphate nucleotidase CysQ [Thermoanaerobaculia bacterium]